MAEASALKARYRASDLEQAFISGKHRTGSADMKVLERFFDPLKRGELDDEAVIVYGTHLMQGDVKYVGVWVEAMQELVARRPHMITMVRLRPNLDFRQMANDSREVSRGLREFMRDVAEELRKQFTPENSVNERLVSLVQQLDHAP